MIKIRAIEFKVFAALFLISAALTVAHMLIVWPPYGTYPETLVSFVHLDREGNLPSWFGSAQFMVLAALFCAISAVHRRLNPAQKHTAIIWLICAAGAVFLSMDEGSQLHEKMGTFVQSEVADAAPGSVGSHVKSFPSYYWLLIYIPLILPVLAFIFCFMKKQLGKKVFVLFTAVTLYLLGAAVLEYLEGRYGTPEHMGIPIALSGSTVWFDSAVLEEFLEMTGVSLAIALFAGHLSRLWNQPNFPAI